ncbi:MAG: phage minor capsid protein [Ruminococcus flavefaciens]|nr:phage minor capsid protein [Ruminococcus flavefaciens]
MLSPEYYEDCADDILALYGQLEDDIISDVVRRIMKSGIVTETAKHQLEQLQEAGLLYDDILSEIAKRTDATENHVKALFEDSGVKSVNFDNKIYRENGLTPVDIRQSPAMLQTLEAGYRKTLGNMKNLTLTTANTSQTAYINACNSAYMQVVSGAFSYQEAIKQAVQRAAQQGATVTYPSGHTERIDVAVRRAVLTGVGQTCREIGLMNAEECGCDLMEISAHSGARPSHAQWQGKIVSLSGRRGYLSKSDIGYGTGDGFGGWNCRHDWYPFFEGYSKPNYSAKDLKKLDERNIEYNGKMYNQYEISQIQRKMEREIRSAKREQVAFKTAAREADDPELKQVMQDSLNYSNSLVKDRQAKMRDFIRQTGQERDYFREQNYPKEKLFTVSDKKYVDKYFWSGIIKKKKKDSISIVPSVLISDTVTNKVNSAIGKIAKDFPIANEQVSSIKYGDLDDAYGLCAFDIKTVINEITLLESIFSDEDNLVKVLHHDAEIKKSYETDCIESLVAHELGHALHNSLTLKRTGLEYGKRMTPFEAIAFDNERKKITQEIYCLYFTDESSTEIFDECARQLGEMARNPNEMIAQAFGNYYYGAKKQPLAKAIVKYFRKEFK